MSSHKIWLPPWEFQNIVFIGEKYFLFYWKDTYHLNLNDILHVAGARNHFLEQKSFSKILIYSICLRESFLLTPDIIIYVCHLK